MKRILIGVALFGFAPIFSQPIEKGPADESAYWILKIHGTLEPIPIISRSSIDFGEVDIGKLKDEKIEILNKGYGTLEIKKLSLEKGTEFAIKKTTCTKPLEFGQRCEIVVEFKPDREGDFSDTLYIETNDKKNPVYTVGLKGVGKGAVIVSPKGEEKPSEVKQPETAKEETKPLPPPPVKKPKYTYWEVKPCDTLWDISATVYGTPLLWAAIFEANRDKIQDPWIIEVGTKLKIPQLTPVEREKYKEETLKLMEEMADRPLGPKCPF